MKEMKRGKRQKGHTITSAKQRTITFEDLLLAMA